LSLTPIALGACGSVGISFEAFQIFII